MFIVLKRVSGEEFDFFGIFGVRESIEVGDYIYYLLIFGC